MNTPDNLRYTAEHEWVDLQDGIATVGITDFAQRELGDIVFVELDSMGRNLQQNEVFGTVEAVKTVSDLYMPLSGEVIAVNPGINSNPEWVNQNPYGDGWMIRIQTTQPLEWQALMDAAAYRLHTGQ
ncbi:MAG: glycine cleavage system protein GcvH [Bacteroidota bacterium]